MREPYEFNPEDAYRFANEQHIQTVERGNELHFKICPYCRGGGGRDQKTFAIDLKTGKFHCLRASCGVSGNMIRLAKDFAFSLGDEVDEWLNHKKRDQYRHLKNIKPKSVPDAIEYLGSRGISEEIAEKYNITVKKDSPNLLMFPFYDENDVLMTVKYRKTDFDKSKDKSKEWFEENCMPILFGMNHCNYDNKTLIMTEGQLDSLSLAEAGIENAVSVPNGAKGFTWTPNCWSFLNRFDELIVFGDYENGSISLLSEMKARFRGRVKHVRPEDYRDCKDANDILRKYGAEALREAVNNAVPISNPRIIRMVDVESVDLLQKEQFSSGIKWLDRLLGGFYFGQLAVLTGERGEGKSTLASQFGTFAVEAGYSVFIYSGEMDADRVQDWFELQAAGSRNIKRVERDDRFTVPLVFDDAKSKIQTWYGDKVLMYNNRFLNEEEEEELLPKTLECAIQQYGCRVLIIDNLMTAISDDISIDIYRQQSAFVRNLAQMSKRYDVMMFLVAHPRKVNGAEITNDSISGSGNITNLADIVIQYGRPKGDPNAKSRVLTVLKNRLTGQIDREGITLYFDESSKRISERENQFDWELGWEGMDRFYVLDDDNIFD